MLIEDEIEIEKVRQNLEAWLAAFNNKDLEKLFSLYDPESIYANAGAALMRGVDQIRPWYNQALAEMQAELLYQEEAALQDGNLAMLLGAYYFRPPAGTSPPADAQLTGRVSLIYRRDKKGVWKLLFDMDNTPPDITPADFA